MERLDLGAARRLFPSLNTDDLRFVLFEPEAGALRAAVATKALAASAVASGAELVRALATPDGARVALDDGRTLEADVVIWACGPWLGGLFGDLVSLRVTRQDLFLFDASSDWAMPPTPGWVDYDGAAYGVGDLDGEGFKVASDVEGPAWDPDTRELVPPPDAEPRARALPRPPLPGARRGARDQAVTCSYALTADTHFIVAPHPEHPGVWLLGGGSGHGFKHGPSVAEYVAEMLAGERPPDPRFALGERSAAGSLRTAGMSPTASRDEAVIRAFVDAWDTQGLETAMQLATDERRVALTARVPRDPGAHRPRGDPHGVGPAVRRGLRRPADDAAGDPRRPERAGWPGPCCGRARVPAVSRSSSRPTRWSASRAT